ncbi:MAG: PIN domain-containing protein [Nanoarchaeota archaeon]
MKKIILDTNFLLIPFQFKIDIFSEIERICDFQYSIFILDKTINELVKIINEQKGKNRLAAKFALDLINTKKIKILKTSDGNVDDILVTLDAIVATQDKILIKRLKNSFRQVIRLRQKKYLMIS